MTAAVSPTAIFMSPVKTICSRLPMTQIKNITINATLPAFAFSMSVVPFSAFRIHGRVPKGQDINIAFAFAVQQKFFLMQIIPFSSVI